MKTYALGALIALAFTLGTSDTAEAKLVFGQGDEFVPIAEVVDGEGNRAQLAYHYQITAVAFPLWLSREGYVLLSEDGQSYVPLGDVLPNDVQIMSGVDDPEPPVPLTGTKLWAYGYGLFGWYAVLLPMLICFIIKGEVAGAGSARETVARFALTGEVEAEPPRRRR